jgi:hypothetical protein
MNIKGKLLEIFEVVQVTDTFKKREFVLEYMENPQYPEFVKFELTQDRCEILNAFKAGEEVEVWFNLRGRKWTDPKGEVKYFNSLQAWRIQQAGAGQQEDSPRKQEEPGWLAGEQDDLPF